MGKSPAKWMKTLLFRKKSSKSNAPKKSANDKKYIGNKHSPSIVVDSPVISQPLPVNAGTNVMPEAERGTPSVLSFGGVTNLPPNHDAIKQNVAPELASIPDRIREDKAAIKVQATFRGFLARRAFRALRGIIRLQALVRGHLVRRQAVATLRCMQRIVKLQALARGRRVRISDVGFEVNKKISKSSLMRAKLLSSITANNSSQKTKLSANAFVCKLLSGTRVFMPLKLQYVTGEPNSVWSWLERWTSSLLWEPLPQLKKTVEVKSQLRHASYTMETESGRQKRSIRRNVLPNSDSSLTNIISDSRKAKHTFRKISSTPAEQIQEHPQSELEKVKHNLRKISNSVAQSTDVMENETERPKNSVQKVLSSATEDPDHSPIDSAEKIKKKMPEIKSRKPVIVADIHAENVLGRTSEVENQAEPTAIAVLVQEVEAVTKLADVAVEDNNASINDSLEGKSQNYKIEKCHPLNGELTLMEEQACQENHKAAAKRRASLSAKIEYLENGSPNTPTLPSYMQATQSAKAKLRGLSSPRFSSEGIDKIEFTRRHSLPSVNGKLGSVPSQVQRIVTGGKGGFRSDKSFASSRDGSDRPIQVEWRR